MRAITFPELGRVAVSQLTQPTIEDPRDAIIRLTTTGICGSDLHLLHGLFEAAPDFAIGHEGVGVVEEIGPAVRDIRVGERYLICMWEACGCCPACVRGEQASCRSIGLFGCPTDGAMAGARGLWGAQAEYMRVPNADLTLWPVPDGVSDEDIFPVTDILSTACTALAASRLTVGETIAIVGAGPVGQLTAMMAPIFGASEVFAIDLLPDRLRTVEQIGAIPVNGADDPVEAIFRATKGRGVDVAIEAVGADAALATACKLTGVGGRVTTVMGVSAFPCAPMDLFYKQTSFTPVVGNPFRWRDPLTKLIAAGRIQPSRIVSHRMSLSDGVEAYAEFEARRANKVVLTP